MKSTPWCAWAWRSGSTPFTGPGRPGASPAWARGGLARRFGRDRIDHIHAPWADGPATAAWVASHLSGIPFSFSARAYDLHPPDGALEEKLAAAVFVRTNTRSNLSYLAGLAPEAAPKLVNIYNGVALGPPGARRPPGGSALPAAGPGAPGGQKRVSPAAGGLPPAGGEESGFPPHPGRGRAPAPPPGGPGAAIRPGGAGAHARLPPPPGGAAVVDRGPPAGHAQHHRPFGGPGRHPQRGAGGFGP